jgi:hypothetical protein
MMNVPMLIPRFRNVKNWFQRWHSFFRVLLFWQYNWGILTGALF